MVFRLTGTDSVAALSRTMARKLEVTSSKLPASSKSALLSIPNIMEKPDNCTCDLFVLEKRCPVWEYDEECPVRKEDHRPIYDVMYGDEVRRRAALRRAT